MNLEQQAYSLFFIHLLTTFVWTFCICAPLAFALLSESRFLFSLNFCLLSSLLGFYRFVNHGEVRKREYALFPHIFRSLILSAPTHVIHGLTVGIMSISPYFFDEPENRSPEDADEVFWKLFFNHFILGWIFSSLYLLQKRYQIYFKQTNFSRMELIRTKSVDVGKNIILLNGIGLLILASSRIYFFLSVALEIFDAIFMSVLSQQPKRGDFDDAKSLIRAMNYHNGDIVQLGFQSLPLLCSNEMDWETMSSSLVHLGISRKLVQSTLSSLEIKEDIQEFWYQTRKLAFTEAPSNNQNLFIALSKNRFELISHSIYLSEAFQEGSVFAWRCFQKNQPVLEANRFRAFISSVEYFEIFGEQDDFIQALNSGLNFIDAQTMKILCFVKQIVMEPPINPETGLENTSAFIQNYHSNDDRDRQLAKDAEFDFEHRAYISINWWKRLLFGDLIYEFDPIYMENLRRFQERVRIENVSIESENKNSKYWKRVIDRGLLDEFDLILQASKSMVRIVKKCMIQRLLDKQIIPLVIDTLQRCAFACEDAEKILSERYGQPESILFQGVQFSLERDIKEFM